MLAARPPACEPGQSIGATSSRTSSPAVIVYGDARSRDSDHVRGGAVVRRHRDPAAAGIVGEHDRRRAELSQLVTVADRLPRRRARTRDGRLLLARRRPPPTRSIRRWSGVARVYSLGCGDGAAYSRRCGSWSNRPFGADEGIVQALRGVSFALWPGETSALVGESGCGKSVTALSIMRLLPSERPNRRRLDRARRLRHRRRLATALGGSAASGSRWCSRTR